MARGSGINDALDARVYETLVAEFGEEKAKAILGGEPARRREQVPDVIGKKAKPMPAWGKPKVRGVSWRERTDRGAPPKFRLVRWRGRAVTCHECGTRIEPGEEHAVVTTMATQRRYCVTCGSAVIREADDDDGAP